MGKVGIGFGGYAGLLVYQESHIQRSDIKQKIETEEDFNPEKLTPEITEINDSIQIITGLRYDGKKLEVNEWGDSWTKNIILRIF